MASKEINGGESGPGGPVAGAAGGPGDGIKAGEGSEPDDGDALGHDAGGDVFFGGLFEQRDFAWEDHTVTSKDGTRTAQARIQVSQAASTDYDQTGQVLWPGASVMAAYIMEHPDVFAGRTVLELGAGMGLPGILAQTAAGARLVVSTDYQPSVLERLRQNIAENATHDAAWGVAAVEWGEESLESILEQVVVGGHDANDGDADGDAAESDVNAGLAAAVDHVRVSGGFDVVIGADVTFFDNAQPALFETALEALRGDGDGLIVIAHKQRWAVNDRHLEELLARLPVAVERVDVASFMAGDPDDCVLFLIRRRSSDDG